MFSMAYTKKLPFNTVYFTGMVRDDQGRKMSKSLGNSPDIITLIEQYGVDALRFSVMIATPTGNDLLFDMKALEQGRNFNNKLWNALKLYKFWHRKLIMRVLLFRNISALRRNLPVFGLIINCAKYYLRKKRLMLIIN